MMEDRAVDLMWVDFARSPNAREAIRTVVADPPTADTTLAALERLRKRFSAEEAAVILTQARLQARAAQKFPHAERMLFEQAALEQATAWPVALHRAQRLHARAPQGCFLDLGCGIGGDLVALAHFRAVVAWESDPSRAEIARANLAALAPPYPVEVRTGDWVRALQEGNLGHGIDRIGAAFVDPGRRRGQKRFFGLEALEPPLSSILPLYDVVPTLAIKGPPGLDDAALPPDCALEFVSHEGVCKEAVIWRGAGIARRREASVFDGSEWHTIVASEAPAPLGAIEPGMILYEPDPALLRAGALTPLCEMLNAHLFDPHIGYLVADEYTLSPFATGFRVREIFPFALRRLNERLRALGIGTVQIKKRGFPQEPESLRPRLKLTPDGPPIVVLLTRRGDDHWAILADRLDASGTGK